MTSVSDRHEPTLGERLALQVREIMARRMADIAWLTALEPVLGRNSALATPAGSRLRRREADVPPVGSEYGASQAIPGAHPVPVPPRARPARPRPDLDRLPAELRERLRPLFGAEIDAVRVHQDDRADEVARAYEADAVTVAEEIFFRAGRFRPEAPDGIALLVHEATHAVEAMRPGSAWQRATSASAAEEEALATKRERAALAVAPWDLARQPASGHPEVRFRDRGVSAPGGGSDRRPSATAAAGPVPSPALRPMPALEGRDLSPEVPATAPVDAQALEQAVVRDLLRQIRTDAERGA